jgi:hypothetical protein
MIAVDTWKSAVDDRELAVDSWFKLYPNPTFGVFTLELSGICGDEVQVTVYGMYGEMILQQKSVQQRRTTFYLEKEPAGIYIVRISSGVDTVFKKIVKL